MDNEESSEIKSNSKLWIEDKDPYTGKSSIEYHKPKIVGQWCALDDHNYELIPGGSREIKCTKCKQTAFIILGRQVLLNGKLKDSPCK